MTFSDNVKDIVRRIPKGKVLTYKQVALEAGNGKASRVVGSIMRKNFDPDIPCHRVIRSDGRIGEYNRGGEESKRKKLMAEGVNLQKLRE